MIVAEWADYLSRVGGAILVAGAVYGGIRSDLKGARERANEAHATATRAHVRIDEHIVDHAKGRGL